MFRSRWITGLGVLASVLVLVGCDSGDGTAEEVVTEAVDKITCDKTEGGTEMAASRLYVEHNATDEDTGVHGGFDDDGWSVLCVYDPDGNQILTVRPTSQLGDLTMAGIFFESREPPNSEYSIDDLMSDFPEGEYEVRGESFDGESLAGSATFTHDIPVEPTITSPVLAEDEDSIDGSVASGDVAVAWEGVTETVSGESVDVVGYEVIVTDVADADPNGFSNPTYDVHLGPDKTSLSVPSGFFEPDTVYELEVLALEVSGNQTISLGFFKTP